MEGKESRLVEGQEDEDGEKEGDGPPDAAANESVIDSVNGVNGTASLQQASGGLGIQGLGAELDRPNSRLQHNTAHGISNGLVPNFGGQEMAKVS